MKNSLKKYIQVEILPYFLQLIVRFIYFTCKKRFHYANVDEKETLLVAMWHGDLLMQPLNYRNFRKSGTIKVIVSEHRDGITIRKVCNYLGVLDIQGSSSKGGVKALLNAIKEIKKGVDVAITPDGPRGPRHSIADGIIAIAQKTDTRIVALNCKASSYWQFNSWDKFVVPKPFGKLDFFVSEPFSISSMQSDEAKDFIKKKLLENAMD